jgi:hypothetical protein
MIGLAPLLDLLAAMVEVNYLALAAPEALLKHPL